MVQQRLRKVVLFWTARSKYNNNCCAIYVVWTVLIIRTRGYPPCSMKVQKSERPDPKTAKNEHAAKHKKSRKLNRRAAVFSCPRRAGPRRSAHRSPSPCRRGCRRGYLPQGGGGRGEGDRGVLRAPLRARAKHMAAALPIERVRSHLACSSRNDTCTREVQVETRP